MIALAAPSFARAACEWACAPGGAVVSGSSASCHEQGASDLDTASIAAAHSCHDLVAGPVVTVPPGGAGANVTAVARFASPRVAQRSDRVHAVVSAGSLTLHGPPLAPIPLRI